MFMSLSVFSQNSESYDSLSKALVNSKSAKDSIGILLALSCEVVGSHPVDGIQFAQKAYVIADQHKLKKEMIQSLVQMGQGYIRSGNYQKAIENAEKALEMAKDLKMENEIAIANGLFSVIFFDLGEYDRSAKFDFENLKYYESVNDQKEIGKALGNIGIDFISQNNYQKGLGFLKKSLEIAVKQNDFDGIAYQYNNIASVYFEYYKNYNMALSYYKEALKINRKLADKQQKGIYQMNIGICFTKLNEKDSILGYYQDAEQLFRNLNNLNLLAECQSLISTYYFNRNDINRSVKYADSALKIGQKYDFKGKVKAAAGLLHKIYLSKNDIENAYKYAMIESNVKDSLFILQNQKEVYRLEFQYNYEKNDKIKQIALQKKENLMIVIILSLISGMIIIILIFSRHRIKARSVSLEKKSIEKELQFKNKELTINLLSLIKKNEMLTDISNKMVEIGKDAKKDETKEAISRISRELRISADDKMLKEFSLRFQEIHTGFYESLLHKYPELTPNELKLCAFLRLNMSSKDISELTGQRLLTIDHARYRLRKKLGISNSEVNLVTFLSQI
jgi:tetratricopeptide (TPR) repeat protein